MLVVQKFGGSSVADAERVMRVAGIITDTAATMAIKAHLRADRPTLFALATNDAMSQNLKNLGTLLCRKRL